VKLGIMSLTLTNASGTFSGVISDAGGAGGSLTIAGGTETLTGTNTYVGATSISSGATLASVSERARAQAPEPGGSSCSLGPAGRGQSFCLKIAIRGADARSP